jgi:CheY-like chemotaxis protein
MRTILVTDDQAEVRDIIVEFLSAPGRTVLAAADAREALSLLAEHEVDLLITDVRMPGMDGFELARQAKALRPGMSIIHLSGYYAEASEASGPVLGPVLRKPFALSDLAAAIWTVRR